LGVGSFGRVELVQDKRDPTQMYALKMQQKHNIMTSKQLENCMNERKLLEECTHPFICMLHATYSDKNLLYMLLECVKGGELFQLLRSTPTHCVPVASCQFYAACVIDALGYLHKMNIIYRDLKPENLLIDADGYIKIVDLGFAKKLKRNQMYRTYTICGTPDYMSPEMLTNLGYNVSVDVWAVGVLIFEMICGYAPFGEQMNGVGKHDAATTMKNIMHQHVLIPVQDSSVIRIIRSLLVKNPINRLGCGSQGGILKLFRHPFFQNINQSDLHQRRTKSPWRPLLEDGTSVVEPAEVYQWEFRIQDYDGTQDYFKEW
jgi:serine/threonine protein kinase